MPVNRVQKSRDNRKEWNSLAETIRDKTNNVYEALQEQQNDKVKAVVDGYTMSASSCLVTFLWLAV